MEFLTSDFRTQLYRTGFPRPSHPSSRRGKAPPVFLFSSLLFVSHKPARMARGNALRRQGTSFAPGESEGRIETWNARSIGYGQARGGLARSSMALGQKTRKPIGRIFSLSSCRMSSSTSSASLSGNTRRMCSQVASGMPFHRGKGKPCARPLPGLPCSDLSGAQPTTRNFRSIRMSSWSVIAWAAWSGAEKAGSLSSYMECSLPIYRLFYGPR